MAVIRLKFMQQTFMIHQVTTVFERKILKEVEMFAYVIQKVRSSCCISAVSIVILLQLL